MNVSVEQLTSLQAQTERIRNICILAHVDHGKTTLSDHLIGSNGLIHPKLMGEMRYLDSRVDEQARGITMKSSSISLLYVPGAAQLPGGPNSCSADDKRDKGILVNLIDSPGHVDFCSEVSTAARLSDGGVVVVDVVEGVCIQTHAVLRQAWEEKVKLTLVINKVDRLILEVRQTPQEAYECMRAIITQVNMIRSGFESERYISEADAVLASQDASAQAATREDEEDDAEKEDVEFSPEKGNVVFASAHDGWGFRTSQFASIYASKLGVNADKLGLALWGDYAYDAKAKRMVKIKRAQQHKLRPLFVQCALKPIWDVYEACKPGADAAGILGKIVKGLNLTQVGERAVTQADPRKALRQVMQAWLPLSEAVLGMAVTHLPSPLAAAKERLPRLLPPQIADIQATPLPSDVQQGLDEAQAAVQTCSTSADAPTVVYVSKMAAVPASALPRQAGEPGPRDPTEERFLAFGRVFAGQLRDGQTVHVLSAAYNPAHPDEHRQTAQINGLFMMMGRGLERLQSGPAGNVVAIGGLEACILKSATLASSPACRPIAPMMFQAAPIVRVAVEPANPTQMQQLVEGLRLLNRADPFVDVVVQESGEHVIGAAGEVHLEMCIKDLRERFARIELQVSKPLVAFRESAFYAEEATDIAPKLVKVVEGRTANGSCIIRVRVNALPQPVAAALDENAELLRHVLASRAQSTAEPSRKANGVENTTAASPIDSQNAREEADRGNTSLDTLRERLHSALEGSPGTSSTLLRRAWMLGPRQIGPNLLLSSQTRGGQGLWEVPQQLVVPLSKRTGATMESRAGDNEASEGLQQESSQGIDVRIGNTKLAATLGLTNELASSVSANGNSMEPPGLQYVRASLESGITAGFQMATANGPLCDEPMWGVAFEVVARLQVHPEEDEASASGRLAEDVYGPLSGQVTSVARQAFRRALLEADPRLVEAMFLCEVSTTAEALSGTYAVLGQRRARVVREELREGSDLFSVHAYLPAQASFGFADDMRRRSSGAASASLMLSHWERLQVDPFFTPKTEEEREEFGEEGQGVGAPNLANVLIEEVRRRKGLPLDKKVVESATKQRTRARKV